MAYTGGTQLSALGNSESWSIYEYPTLYEAAFTRDYVSEVCYQLDPSWLMSDAIAAANSQRR